MKISYIKQLIDEYELSHNNQMPTHVLVSCIDYMLLNDEAALIRSELMFEQGNVSIDRVKIVGSKQIKKDNAICVSSI
jgi:hypothetical protein